ncbi:DUF4276 family protein [Pseudanabaena sp. UWO310]|uniref:DUF4276 family protein n=1 Tax=Pseudanabaena sp. UWO310 TaxID=2480795 RepID=UPI001159E3B5|nr:DUF4276 family protein [Pseudanabaena sp. UWO310]TYQ31113.1 DUF4276 family protein [Pseudanabaena sp. UWO310]
MSNLKIGLIAEDVTDCDAVREIIRRVLNDSSIRIIHWAAKGCGNLRKDLSKTIKAISKEDCNAYVIVHDLDRQNGCLNDESTLRASLEKSIIGLKGINRHICIPIEELEAWFWSDLKVVKFVGQGKGKAHANPQQIEKPKEKLIKLSAEDNRKPRYSTNMNAKLASILDIEECSKRCSSFRELVKFLRSL